MLYYFALFLCVAVSKRRVSSVDGSPVRTRRMSRTGSVDTLSPCESITSDDLMLDYERSEGSIFDCTAERYYLLYPNLAVFELSMNRFYESLCCCHVLTSYRLSTVA